MTRYKVVRKPKKKDSKLQAIIYLLLIALVCASACIFGIKIYLKAQPPIKNLETFKPNIVTKIYSSDGEIIKTFTAFKFEKVDIKDIPDDLKNAIVATEDKNFYKHDGYDPIGVARSIFVNAFAGRAVQGGSTITQQLARILFLSNEKTFMRKIKEMIISARIEKSLPKDKILEMYLNNVYLGSGAYGVAGAATIYFNKPLKKLTLSECALIAGLPQAPSVYSPFNDQELAIKRRDQVLTRMYKMNFISKQEMETAKHATLTLNSNPNIYSLNRAPYFIDYAMKELEMLGFDEKEISQGGYKITTTLNYRTQEAAERSLRSNMASWGLTGKNQQGAIFTFSPINGRILAYIGGKDYGQSQYDRVTQAVRPPGSSFKPFVYAAAIESGYTPNDMIDDTPVKIAKWTPRNYGNKYRGSIPMYAGLMLSSNVMAARLIKDVGIRAVIDMARSLGISTPLEYDYTIALGSNGVKLYEMTIAFGAFGNGGYKVKPYSIEQIETSRGQIIYQAPRTRVGKVLNINTAAALTAMLKLVITNGTGMAANIGKPAAGKTGTTDDYKDAWFVGYTPNVVTGVWVGNDDNSKMHGSLTGGTVPALIWKDTMKVATEKYGNNDFDYPPVEIKMTKLPAKVSMELPTETDENKQRETSTDENTEYTDIDMQNIQQQMPQIPANQFTFTEMKNNQPKAQAVQNNSVVIPIKPAPPAAPQAPVPTRINY